MALRTAPSIAPFGRSSPPIKLAKEPVWTKLHEKYQSCDVLGQGTYGIVYKAEKLVNGQTVQDANKKEYVALKRTALDASLTHGIPDTALREMSILKDMDHPNIIDAIEFSCNPSRIYLVMELLDKDLKQHIRSLNQESRLMPVHQVRQLMFKVLQGISYLHAHGILHRDLKPHNILVSENLDQVKLADFGLARATHCTAKTLTHEVITLWYRPPEILLGDCVYDNGVDIWSLGCIMAELLSPNHGPLFDGESELDTLLKIYNRLGTPSKDDWPPNALQLRECFPDFPTPTEGAFKEIYKRFNDSSDAELAEDLIMSMLQLNGKDRLTAKDCINHPWFDSIRADPEFSIYQKYHPLEDIESRDEEKAKELISEDGFFCHHLNSLSSLHSASSFDETDFDAPLCRSESLDRLLLTLSGLDADDVLHRSAMPSEANGLEHDENMQPMTPSLTATPTGGTSMPHKRGDRLHARPRSSDALHYPTLPHLGTVPCHQTLSGPDNAMNRTPRPDPFQNTSGLEETHAHTASHRHYGPTHPPYIPLGNSAPSHLHSHRLNSEGRDYDPLPHGETSSDGHGLSAFITPAALVNSGSVISSISRRISRDLESMGSALSRGLAGVLHWQDTATPHGRSKR